MSFSDTYFASLAGARKARKRYSARVFYLVILVVLAVALGSRLVPRDHNAQDGFSAPVVTRRNRRSLVPGTESWTIQEGEKECRLVHRAKHQCSFIRDNCEDENIGLIPYLEIYYCWLGGAKPVGFALLSAWLAMLFSTVGIAASDFLCVNLSTIANILGMSESLTGVTFLAFGNGSPDVFSTFAAMSSNSGSLAIGELVGAAGFITAVVAGSMALTRPFKVARRSFVRDILFFAVATGFTMGFVADGKLHAWECASMIGFYIFYVFIVVTWHWYMGRQRQRIERDIAARAHFHIPQNQELEINEVPEDDDPIAGGESRPLLGATNDDFGSLERADIPTLRIEDEGDEEERDRQQLAELHENMRVNRPQTSQRMLSSGGIRPSLVGALEFRSVLSSLEKSRNLQSGRIHLRSYSDDPFSTTQPAAARPRASTAQQPQFFSYQDDDRAGQPGLPTSAQPQMLAHSLDNAPGAHLGHQTNLLCASPTSSGYPSRSHSPAPSVDRSKSPGRLAVPRTVFQQPTYGAGGHTPSIQSSISPQTTPPACGGGSTPASPESSITPFPPYTDETAYTPHGPSSLRFQRSAHSLSSEYTRAHSAGTDVEISGPKWWPRSVLPFPLAIISALFPTLYDWGEKSIWDKFLGIAAAPSVFVLTMTLPVVETDGSEPEAIAVPEQGAAIIVEQRSGLDVVPTIAVPNYHDDETAVANSQEIGRPSLNRLRQDSELPSHLLSNNGTDGSCYFNCTPPPLFITITLWNNLRPEHDPSTLILPVLLSLLLSSAFTIVLLFATKASSSQLPKPLRPFVAFLGFTVAIAWVSTLATEVVALLKLFGVVLNISDSLLGLTIFAVGNSLGDLVADVTIARLGYPVMALSACFGGPMLNILIGIGVGGLYMTFQPIQNIHSASINTALSTSLQPYPITVSKTLIISAATLMITLLGLLIVVPLNKWRMDKNVGFGLVALWCISTIINVVLELVS
ncbi:sodium/calcium exchanger protein [Nannizzia gypsea CBS 118893]|uniref:Sodium/calcium exchanger protein n=1 Tax=Arthroderma gypseum (strain ATCC MYA-4604 / CBS 118893) TaxID=535722 RepID=E4UX51_ARTGP|nr:sodium/calcium exchanger protein [Nannizzia gypsea CBS 118893]EFR01851.1 sodium/calcium exchanger protein [Nannizzia gypsea CBS 118893]